MVVGTLEINSHRHRAGKILPTAAPPELASGWIIVCHQNNGALESGATQTIETFIDQASADSATLIRRLDGEMINMSAPAIMSG